MVSGPESALGTCRGRRPLPISVGTCAEPLRWPCDVRHCQRRKYDQGGGQEYFRCRAMTGLYSHIAEHESRDTGQHLGGAAQ